MSVSKVTSEVDRVAGESELVVSIGDGSVRVEYSSVASPRSFETLVKGRKYEEVPYVVSRICGICSHAHFWASNLAVESALNISVDDVTAALRDACNKVQVVQNHLIHLAFLALPDYDTGDLAKGYLARLMRFNNALNNVLQLLGGRLTNPNVYLPGGFTTGVRSGHVGRALALLKDLIVELEGFVEAILSVEIPDLKDPSPEYVALCGSPFKTVPEGGPYLLDTSRDSLTVYENYRDIFREQSHGGSTSKKCLLGDKAFYVGARARLLNLVRHDSSAVEEDLRRQLRRYEDVLTVNPFSNIYAKALESIIILKNVVDVLDEHLGREPKPVSIRGTPKGGHGVGIVEAPRGLLIHHYEIDRNLRVVSADIITPTVMFSRHIEVAAEALVGELISRGGMADKSIRGVVEALVRAYDPCIPCAVHVIRR
ncbi:MAG: nickel-dependent hydrogenase large subunit [Zestosphaera sp.]